MRRAEHQPEEVEIAIYAGVFVKTWSVREAGTLLPQHAHDHPHCTLIMRGAVRVWCDGARLGDFRAPAVVKIPAHTLHNFLTLTHDVALACVHNADRYEGDEPAISRENSLALED